MNTEINQLITAEMLVNETDKTLQECAKMLEELDTKLAKTRKYLKDFTEVKE